MATPLDELRRASSKKRRSYAKPTGLKRVEARWGWFFISPFLIGFLLFGLVPIIASLIFSFLRFELTSPDEIQWVGLDNWGRMLFNDPTVIQSIKVTFLFGIVTLPIGLASALAMALMLNSKYLAFNRFFRTLFYMPAMVPLISSVLIWRSMLNPTTGWINNIIQKITGYEAVGLNGLRWLADPKLLYIGYTMMGIWGIGTSMLLFLAALQGVPTELYDAASVEGAGWWKRLRHITLPMISPVMFFNLVISVVDLFQYFLVPYTLNRGNGEPKGWSLFYQIYLYKQAFGFNNMGYGAALAWFLFIMTMGVTAILLITAKRWVYYAGEGETRAF